MAIYEVSGSRVQEFAVLVEANSLAEALYKGACQASEDDVTDVHVDKAVKIVEAK